MKTICIRKTEYRPIRGQEMGVPMDGFCVIVDARIAEIVTPGRVGKRYCLSKYGILLSDSRELATTEARMRAEELGLPFAVLQSVALLQPSYASEQVFTSLAPD